MGIHYDYKSTRGAKAMEKQAKREKKLAERRAKRAAKDGLIKQKEETKMHDISKTITLEDLTNPEKDKWVKKKNFLNLNKHLKKI